MIDIRVLDGLQKELLKPFEDEQWPLADEEHYGHDLPAFRKDSRTIIASQDGRIIGFAEIFVDTGVAHLENIIVHAEERGKNVGAALLMKAEETAKALGVHKMKTETGATWGARAFYEKHGYVLRAELKNYYGNRDFVLLDKEI